LTARTDRGVAPAIGVLRYRDFRHLLMSQALTNVGTWMQITILPWLVLQRTGSNVLVGVTVATQSLPILIAGPLGGLLADRVPRRRIVLVTQVAAALPAFGLAVVASAGSPSYTLLFAGGLLWGVIQLFDAPARQALIADAVPTSEVTRAYALSISMWQVGSVTGPALVGLILSTATEQVAFLVMAVLLVAGAMFLITIRDHPIRVVDGQRTAPDRGALAGLVYARNNQVVAALLVLVTGFSLFAMNRQALVPLFADKVLDVDSSGFGILMAASGAGALAGGLLLAVIGHVSPRLHIWLGLSWAVTIVVFGLNTWFWPSAALLAVSGVCQMTFMTIALGRLQMETPADLRGRVMAFHSQAVNGAAPVGAAQVGLLADVFGVAGAAVLCGILSAAVAIAVWGLSPRFRSDAILAVLPRGEA
jgi:MFS family permease